MRDFELSADEFPYARINEFIDLAMWDAPQAVARLLDEREYRRIAREERGAVWASILYVLRSTGDETTAAAVIDAMRAHLPAHLLAEFAFAGRT